METLPVIFSTVTHGHAHSTTSEGHIGHCKTLSTTSKAMTYIMLRTGSIQCRTRLLARIKLFEDTCKALGFCFVCDPVLLVCIY